MTQYKLTLTSGSNGCRVNNRRLEVKPGDTVGWHGASTVGCVVFDAAGWPFVEGYTKIDVPQAAQPSTYFTVRQRNCQEDETCYYDLDCNACSNSLAGNVEQFVGGGARIIIK